MELITGVKSLKDKWREAKLRCGDMRGMTSKSRFELGIKFGIIEMQIAFDSIAPKQGKIEIQADITYDNTDWGCVYSMKDLLDEVKNHDGIFEIQLMKVQWNKLGTDAVRSNIGKCFQYINKQVV